MKGRRPPSPYVQLLPQTFANGGFTLQFYRPYLIIYNGDTAAHSITFTLKAVEQENLKHTVVLEPDETESYPVEPYQSVAIDTPTAAVVSFYSFHPVRSYQGVIVVNQLAPTTPTTDDSGTSLVGTVISNNLLLSYTVPDGFFAELAYCVVYWATDDDPTGDSYDFWVEPAYLANTGEVAGTDAGPPNLYLWGGFIPQVNPGSGGPALPFPIYYLAGSVINLTVLSSNDTFNYAVGIILHPTA